MRKFWFAYMAKALVVFPGGFGTLDEMFELLTLAQTDKLEKQIQIILYGSEYWDPILHFGPMLEWGAIAPDDPALIHRADTPEVAFELLKGHLTAHHLEVPEIERHQPPSISKTRR
jgi:predicted Rossmann-fold nucleotide-binding protein